MFNETYRQMKYRIRKDSYKKCVKLKAIMLALLGVFFFTFPNLRNSLLKVKFCTRYFSCLKGIRTLIIPGICLIISLGLITYQLPYSGPHTRDTHAHHDHLLAVLLVSLPLSIQITTHFTRMGKREGGGKGGLGAELGLEVISRKKRSLQQPQIKHNEPKHE